MTDVHGVVGEKGGSGKSIFSLCLADYLEQHDHNFVICDADRSNGDVGNAYEGKQKVIRSCFTENTNEIYRADEILEVALNGADILLNTPAQSHRAIHKWFSLGSASLALEEGINFYFWFVTSGSQDSINLFLKSLEEFQDIPHCLVRNGHYTDPLTYDYSDPESWPLVKEAIEAYGVPVVYLPALDNYSIDVVRNHRLTLTEAREGSKELGICPRSRLRKGLEKIHEQLDKLEVFSCDNRGAGDAPGITGDEEI